ncbi:hypothetical protein INS49_005397 [Diaporthe citri]|uniref:uncharacterized protein n=1 Tax=Diaporthe citri TaxID=83186 RepID=UPI001C81BF14|nr:uncharacterized protein INS49_005397 [Diaporthe citri]KAG6353688.1 hypothetical protein INS49_005397 [Diaporthe citri]
MSANGKSRRQPSSCINCRRRKIKCEKSPSRDCERCHRLGLSCAATDEVVARPYYHTSKAQFELMASTVRHFSPDIPPSVPALPEMSRPHHQSLGTTPSKAHGFDGASSHAVVQSKISSCIGDRSPKLAMLQDQRVDLLDGRPLAGLPAIGLPDRKTCEQCGLAFLRSVNSVIYFFIPETFFNSLEMIYSGGNTPLSVQVIIHLIVALVVNCSTESFEYARMHMESVIEEGSLASVQTIMLMALYRQRHNQRHTGWITLGSATRIPQSLGLFLRVEDESPMVAEQRTRLWWSLYELDQWSSCILGKYSDATFYAESVLPPSDTITAGITSPPMYAAASAQLAKFLSRAMRSIFLKQQCRQQDVEMLVHDLKAWWTTLPDHLTKETIPASFARAVLYLRLRYHYILVLITRLFLVDAVVAKGRPARIEITTQHVVACENHNDGSMSTLLDMHSRDLLSDLFWFDAQHILSTSLILFLRVIDNPSSAELRKRVTSMQQLLHLIPGKIQAHANDCFPRILEDIDARSGDDQITEITFDSVVADLELLDESDLFQFTT